MSVLEVTKEIQIDHDNVRDLFQRFKSATEPSEKTKLANTLVREMAIHGDAEEMSVYTDYKVIGLGDAAKHNLEEHAEIKRLVHEIDTSSVKSADFDAIVERAVTAFITHAKEEEEEQLPLIRQKLSPQDNDRIAREFLKARKAAPTRPHPAAPQTGGFAQKAMDVQGGIVDKLVETVQGREYSSLKLSHPEL